VEISGIDWMTGIAERDGRLVALGTIGEDQLGIAMAFSDDGQVWTAIDLAAFDLDAAAAGSVSGGEPGFAAIAYPISGTLSYGPPVYLFSADGETWEAATPPADCTFSWPAVFGQLGFVTLGFLCRGEGSYPPGPLHVLTSVDGRAWTSRLDPERTADGWATDGRRLVLLTNTGSIEPASVWLTDDLGTTWRYVETPFPPDVAVYDLIWGHDRYVATASWLIREGDPDSAICVSADGMSWQCEVIAATGDLAHRDNLGGTAVTPTGFISLSASSFGEFNPIEMIMARSIDGLTWSFERVREMENLQQHGFVWTSHGLFAWGETTSVNPEDISQPFIEVHRAPLP